METKYYVLTIIILSIIITLLLVCYFKRICARKSIAIDIQPPNGLDTNKNKVKAIIIQMQDTNNGNFEQFENNYDV